MHDEYHFTSIFVTHDQEEALELSDQVVVMSQGQVEQVNSPTGLYARPESRFVFDFLGHVNVLSGLVKGQKLVQGDAWVSLPGGIRQDQEAQLYLRPPHEVQLSRSPPAAKARLPPLRIEAISLIGSEVRIELAPPEGWQSDEIWEIGMSHAEFARQNPPTRGELWYAVPDVGHLFVADSVQPRTIDWQYTEQPTPAICDRRSGGYPPAVVVTQRLVALHSVQPEPAVFHQSPDIRVTPPDYRFNTFRRCIDHHRKAHWLMAPVLTVEY